MKDPSLDDLREEFTTVKGETPEQARRRYAEEWYDKQHAEPEDENASDLVKRAKHIQKSIQKRQREILRQKFLEEEEREKQAAAKVLEDKRRRRGLIK